MVVDTIGVWLDPGGKVRRGDLDVHVMGVGGVAVAMKVQFVIGGVTQMSTSASKQAALVGVVVLARHGAPDIACCDTFAIKLGGGAFSE